MQMYVLFPAVYKRSETPFSRIMQVEMFLLVSKYLLIFKIQSFEHFEKKSITEDSNDAKSKAKEWKL